MSLKHLNAEVIVDYFQVKIEFAIDGYESGNRDVEELLSALEELCAPTIAATYKTIMTDPNWVGKAIIADLDRAGSGRLAK